MGLFFIAGAIVFLSVIAYVLIMIFFPEWVGITGKTAKENQKSHSGESQESDALSRFLDK